MTTSRLSVPAIFRLASLQSVFLGLFASVYLLYTYVSHKPIVCGSSGGCEIVRLSKWAYVFGTIPRPALGVLFYGAVFLLLLLRVATNLQPRLLWRAMQALIVIGLVESVALFFIQWREIGAFCVWCLTSAFASVELALVACFDRSMDALEPTERHQELQLFLVLMVGLTLIFLVGLWWLLR